jgi:hypothetical protein
LIQEKLSSDTLSVLCSEITDTIEVKVTICPTLGMKFGTSVSKILAAYTIKIDKVFLYETD